MNNFFCILESLLIFHVGFGLCVINDTVLSDSWDDWESVHADFSSSDQMSDECAIFENQSMINEPYQNDDLANAMRTIVPGETHLVTTSLSLYKDLDEWEELLREMQYEVPQETSIDTSIPHQPPPSSQMESTSEMHRDSEMTEPQQKKVRKQARIRFPRFVTIGLGSRRPWGNMTAFENLSPGLSIAYELYEEQVVQKINSFQGIHRWKALSDYPIQDYYGYWANVCDYFWVKTTPNDEMFRGCYVRIRIFPASKARILYKPGIEYFKSVKLETLACRCYFYCRNFKEPKSTIADFSVHKFDNSEYFILEEIPGHKNTYSITNLLTQVYLPNPPDNLMMQKSNHMEDPRTDLRDDTETKASKRRNLPRKKFITIGSRSKIMQRESRYFDNLNPGKSNQHHLSQEQLEMIFVSQENRPQWKELKQYSLDMYLAYWGNVCDFFWKKPIPDGDRFRGCYVSISYFPHSRVTVVLYHVSDLVNSQKLDALQCQCYHYIGNMQTPYSNLSNFAIHKHRDNEYFVLDKVPGTRYRYKIVDLITEVYLPDPLR